MPSAPGFCRGARCVDGDWVRGNVMGSPPIVPIFPRGVRGGALFILLTPV